MIDGRIVAGAADLGSGFCLTDRIVATAAHVVRHRGAHELEFVTAAGVRLPVEAVHADPAIDVATLRVAESLAIVPPLTHAVLRADWRVTARPRDHDAQLTGPVPACGRRSRTAGYRSCTTSPSTNTRSALVS
ncbi:serine protease [Dactylosporangium sp. NPDC050688]|uniref:S1 family peptidase n=1 Tax=Dactylosporangium sp. NPDC050688 TaxID=3157217 RepID=UPI003408AE85